MATTLYYADGGGTGRTLYAKPLPIVASPWDGDDVALTESGTTDTYASSPIATPAAAYIVYAQTASSPASSDEIIGTIETSAATLTDAVAALGSPLQDDDARLDHLDAAVSSRATPADVQAASPAGDGDTVVNHDTGGSDNLRLTDITSGGGIDNAAIRAFLKSEYDADPTSATLRAGPIHTGSDGRWIGVMMLSAGLAHTIVFSRPGYNAVTKEVTP